MQPKRPWYLSKFFWFFIANTLSLVLLSLIPINAKSVAAARWREQLLNDKDLRHAIESNCSVVVGTEQSDSEEIFLRATQVSQLPPATRQCHLRVNEKGVSRLGLNSFWAFSIMLESKERGFEFQKTFSFSFPHPIVLSPLVAWLLGLLLGVRFFHFVWAVVIYLLLSAGLNPREVSILSVDSLARMIVAENNFLPVCALLIWSLLVKHSKMGSSIVWPTAAGRLLGIWNPTALAGIIPVQYRPTSIFSSLMEQALCTCLSAYILTTRWSSFKPLVANLLLPRYFTAAVIIIVGFSWLRQRASLTVQVKNTAVLRSVIAVLIVEILAKVYTSVGEMDLFLRITLALNAGLLITPRRFAWKEVAYDLKTSIPWLCLGLFVATFTLTSGITSVLLESLNPLRHPHRAAHYTFFSGVFLGVITGNFSYSYFTLLPLLGRYESVSIVKAALIDGVTAGTLASPFHPLTLITAGYFSTTFYKSFEQRLKVLALPLALSASIYSLGSFRAFSMLQPISFTFLCLVIAAFFLKRNRWSFS